MKHSTPVKASAVGPLLRVLDALQDHGFPTRPCGEGRRVGRCPSHRGSKFNLSIAEGRDGAVLLKCHHEPSCPLTAILDAIGLEMRDLFPPTIRDPSRNRRVHGNLDQAGRTLLGTNGGSWRCWTYRDADGRPLMGVVRVDRAGGKTYRPYRWVGHGWLQGDPDGLLPLLNLPEIAAEPRRRVLVCEGEKAADLATQLGFLATTSAHGAGSPHRSDWGPLAGRMVAILPDNDDEGERYAARVRSLLEGLRTPAVVRVVRLDGLPPKGDLEQWLRGADPRSDEGQRAGDALDELIDRAFRETRPPCRCPNCGTTFHPENGVPDR